MRRTLTAVTAAALLAGAVLAGQSALTAQTTSTTEPERTDWAHLPVWTSMYGHVAGENDEMVVFAWPHSFSADPAGRLPSNLRVNRIRVDQRRLHIDTSSRLTGIDSLEGALLRFTHATNGKSHEMALADAVEHDDGEWDLIWPEADPLPITEAGRWTIELDYPDSYRTVVSSSTTTTSTTTTTLPPQAIEQPPVTITPDRQAAQSAPEPPATTLPSVDPALEVLSPPEGTSTTAAAASGGQPVDDGTSDAGAGAGAGGASGGQSSGSGVQPPAGSDGVPQVGEDPVWVGG